LKHYGRIYLGGGVKGTNKCQLALCAEIRKRIDYAFEYRLFKRTLYQLYSSGAKKEMRM